MLASDRIFIQQTVWIWHFWHSNVWKSNGKKYKAECVKVFVKHSDKSRIINAVKNKQILHAVPVGKQPKHSQKKLHILLMFEVKT